MYCLIRVNAHPQLGNGHLMRCLTLARIAHGRGYKPVLVLSDLPGVPTGFIREAGFNYVLLPAANETQDATNFKALIQDLDAPCRVVVDVYAFAAIWHRIVYPLCEYLLVIDDLANRTYCCDVLLDQTPGRSADDYKPLVNNAAQVYAGCEHALLAPEFFAAVNDAKRVREHYCAQKRLPRLLVSLGGTDPKELSHIWFHLLAPVANEFADITFLLASNAVGLNSLAKKIAIHQQTTGGIELLVDVRHMPQLLLEHDLAIGGAGVSALERAVLGLPSLLLTLADNQIIQAQALITIGCARNLGDWQQVPSISA
ncbi:MAG TPA: UDP-2,4-diacetamido-2,4,6-trideoxy-beta-L-altropyranose hydrolase, partial [Cellvibrionaceae bacterium]|nr:UDP-2,4-diacetamido-2,4,6-trideoxy-beta-L-altropyranose hydrolase [Cellvibrionaceae bacterium]